MFIEKIRNWAIRESPVKLTKMKLENEDAIPRWEKARKIKDYDYYICDYCGKEIKIADKWENQTGGIVKISIPLTICNKPYVILALHNNCCKDVLNKINDEQIIQENENHYTH